MGKTFLMAIIVLPLIQFSAPSKHRLDDFAAPVNADGKPGKMQPLMKTVTLTEGGQGVFLKVIDVDALAEKLGPGGVLKLTVPSEAAAAASSSAAPQAQTQTPVEKTDQSKTEAAAQLTE